MLQLKLDHEVVSYVYKILLFHLGYTDGWKLRAVSLDLIKLYRCVGKKPSDFFGICYPVVIIITIITELTGFSVFIFLLVFQFHIMSITFIVHYIQTQYTGYVGKYHWQRNSSYVLHIIESCFRCLLLSDQKWSSKQTSSV